MGKDRKDKKEEEEEVSSSRRGGKDDNDDDNNSDIDDKKRERQNNRRSRREDDRREKKKKKRRRRSDDDDDDDDSVSDDDDDDDSNSRGRKRDKKRRSHRKKDRNKCHRSSSSRPKHKRHKKKRSYRSSSSSSSDSESSSSSLSSSSDSKVDKQQGNNNSSNNKKKKVVINKRLLAKLQARGETLEERNQRRAQKRAAYIQTKFGYTPEDNPFNDPNLHEKFTWKKKEAQASTTQAATATTQRDKTKHTTEFYDEIEKVRKRREERELQREEMERIRAEESRMKELENYDEWAKKEELFHLQQQRQRSAIRLVEGREKPIDVLAKNLLLFGLSDEEKSNRASVKYKEKYNAMEALASLDVELEEPHNLLKKLKLVELEELRVDIDAFRTLEREASDSHDNPVLEYWDALALVTEDEIKFLKSGGADGAHGKMVGEVEKIFKGRSITDLVKMKEEVAKKLRDGANKMDFDSNYWQSVAEQLDVYLAKATLSDMHSKMLVRQLEKLEERREELARHPEKDEHDDQKPSAVSETGETSKPENDAFLEGGGDLEEELGLSSEIALAPKAYGWQDKYAPRRPRYFNRVKTGYDWNKYNQTHYDRDNPPPKVVQGYKFNIFYPDLIDPTKTPQFTLEPADSDDFCIIRFHAGAPYEDVAFKIVNREWNRRRKKGFKCTFERGVLSLYFNFTTHWYRR